MAQKFSVQVDKRHGSTEYRWTKDTEVLGTDGHWTQKYSQSSHPLVGHVHLGPTAHAGNREGSIRYM